MNKRESFNTAAELYDQVRPSYPKQSIDWIIKETNIKKDSNILEIAPGTGQATLRFAERGYQIHAVELGDKLAEILRENTRQFNVTVDVSPFEEWLTNETYDMIYCATAFHWLDPEIRYQKCYELLKENGYLVLLWNNAAVGLNNPIMDKAYEMMFEYYPEISHSTKPKSIDVTDTQKNITIKEFNESGYFEFVDSFEVDWTFSQSKENSVKGFYSQSSYLSLKKEDREELTNKLNVLFKSLEDTVEARFITRVYIGKKIS